MMKQSFHSRALASCAIGAALAVGLASVAAAQSSGPTYKFNIPAEDLSTALRALARTAGQQIVFDNALVRDKTGPKLSGVYTADEGLTRLLAGSGLSVKRTAAGVLYVVPAAQVRADLPADNSNAGETAATPLAEVIVTATKRPEAVRKISGSVTALTGAQLETLGANSLSDYIAFAPGVVFNANIPGESGLAIRGVSTTTTVDEGQSATGYFINDVPLSDPFIAVGIPDIDAFDVDNISVLRGPQGTLFGSASLGGAINYQAAKPNLDHYQAEVQGTVEGVDHGGDGGSGKVMVNLPIVADTLAVRGVYVYRDDAGFVDNIGTGVANANSTLVRGGRFEVTWAPTSTTQVNYMFLDQSEDSADAGYTEPETVGAYRKSTVIPEPDKYTTLIHNLRLDQDLGFATLTATATYHDKTSSTVTDGTADYARLLPGSRPISITDTAFSRGENFEVRLASPSGQRLEYVVGAMYDNTQERFANADEGANAAQSIENTYAGSFGAGIGARSAPGNVFYSGATPFNAQETAAFGEVTYHLSDQWKITLGGRAFDMRSQTQQLESGFFELLISGNLTSANAGDTHQSGFTPKASITWTPNSNVLAYFLVSQGYRFGGPNTSPSEPGSPIPRSYGSDSLVNYESGVRTNWFDNRLQFDLTAYYIDWKNIQLNIGAADNLAYTTNAGDAHNYGLEATATWRIARGLTFQTNLTSLTAQLAGSFPQGFGVPPVASGTTLPGASKWQVSNILNYQWFDGPLQPSFVVTNRYISPALGSFPGDYGVAQGGYDLVGARVTLHLKSASVTAFVDNIADTRGVTEGTDYSTIEEYIVRPRTIGITFDYRM